MSAPIPLRRDFIASQLRSLAKKTKDGPQARRLLDNAGRGAPRCASDGQSLEIALQIRRTDHPLAQAPVFSFDGDTGWQPLPGS
jgi:hypothetical protein